MRSGKSNVASGFLAISSTLFIVFETVVNRIPDHMCQWVRQAFDNGFVHFCILTFCVQADFFPYRCLGLSDYPGHTLKE